MLFYDQLDDSTNFSDCSHSHKKVPLEVFTTNRAFIGRTKTVNSFYKKIKSKISPKKSRVSCPKKEYIRCKVIRGTKKSIRLLSKSSSQKKLGKFFIFSNENKTQWNLMIHHFNSNREILEKFSSTKSKIPGKEFKSYNISFCKMFFEMPEVREAFHLYVNYIFSDYDCDRLCKEFNFQCCLSEKHSHVCEKKWRELKEFILWDMMEELGFSIENCQNFPEKYDVENPVGVREVSELVEFEAVEEVKFEGNFCVESQPKWIQRMVLIKLSLL